MAAQAKKVGCQRSATDPSSREVGTARSGEVVVDGSEAGRRSDSRTVDAQTRFAPAPIHSVPSRPKRGSSSQVAPIAPAAAPSVLSP